jgi:hypothetical protein
MQQPTPEALPRTTAFARVIGPFLVAATLIVAVRLPDLGGLLDDLFDNSVLPWILGAMMLVCGLIIIAFHQFWHSAAATLISLFGWFVALRGLTLMAFPSAIEPVQAKRWPTLPCSWLRGFSSCCWPPSGCGSATSGG